MLVVGFINFLRIWETIDMAKAKEVFNVEDIPPYQQKKTEKYMSKKMQEHFKTILSVWKEQLLSEVERTVDHLKAEAENPSDQSDRATQEEIFGFELRERDRGRKLTDKIDVCLKRIEDGSYGFCEQCDNEIGLRRLEARPTATLCIDCKTLDEIREKQRGS